MTDKAATILVYRIVIKASAQAIWDAITKPEWTERYAYGGRVQYELKGGGHYHHEASPEMKSFGLPDKVILGEVARDRSAAQACADMAPAVHAGNDCGAAFTPHLRNHGGARRVYGHHHS